MNSYNQQMLGVLRGVPGVSSAATVTGMPLRYHSDGMPFTLVGVADVCGPMRSGQVRVFNRSRPTLQDLRHHAEGALI